MPSAASSYQTSNQRLTMNVTWVFAVALALAGVATAGPTGDSHNVQKSEGLALAWNQFLNLVPGKEYIRILEDYMAHDREFEAAVDYFFSNAFKDTLVKINSIGDVINLKDYLEEAGMDIYYVIDELLKIVGPLPPGSESSEENKARRTGGPAGIIADLKANLKVDEIKALHEEQLESSPAFARFVHHLKSPRFLRLIEALRVNREFQKQLQIAKHGGIYINDIVDLVASMAGIKFPSLEHV